ncbi:hypothetical protein E2562_014286 [Oryza meyeriana var. granulata]|uniref:Uncharacterized protein n=1 Tax=Oryza meyeriana var. granulata TaxID=110450 RepID=A0A6G1C6Q4_9ORYZ|nr:hypothetical protein E2562_014286 [Oryza meyeriana var. granulata]
MGVLDQDQGADARRSHPGKGEVIRQAVLPLTLFEKRPPSRSGLACSCLGTFAGHVHLWACLEGVYHFIDEPSNVCE